jgi:autotransporter-associated beta strand protein
MSEPESKQGYGAWRQAGHGISAMLLGLSMVLPATAATKTWDGSSSGNWNTTANWAGNIVPADGDDLIFPPNAARFAITNDISGLNLRSITFSGSNYVLRGNFITLTNGVTGNYSNSTSTVDLPIQLDAAQTFNCTNSGSFLVFNGDITNNGHLLTVAGSGTTTFGATANITGSGGFTKNGSGNAFLEASNSFSGVVTINSGELLITHSSALGTTAGGTVVQGTGTLVVQSGVHVGFEALTLNAPDTTGPALTSVSGGGSNSWAGTITLATNVEINVPSSATINLAGAIQGSGTLTSDGLGTLIFSGSAANTYTNATTVTAGTLELSKSSFSAIHGPLIIGDGVGGANADVVKVTTHLQIANTSQVVITNSGLLLFANSNQNQYIGSLAGNGNVSLPAALDFETGYDNSSTTFSGIISGGAGMHKQGIGTMTLSGSNTYTGTTFIGGGGSLIINGFQPQSPVSVSSGTLGGGGTVGDIQNLSSISPGGVLTSSNLDLVQFSRLNVELNASLPGPGGYDQLRVRGTNHLTGAILGISVGFIPVHGQSFIIVSNDAAEPITGTFAGLPEGAVTNVNGVTLAISYAGGNGNDVTLTALSTTHTWNGASDGLWTNLYNWVGKVAPVAGDSLIFPAGAARPNNTNNLPPGTAFNSITIASNGYTLNGNPLTISNGIHGAFSTNSSDVNIPLTLAQPQTFTNSGAGTLNFRAPLDNGGNTLGMQVSGGMIDFVLNSPISGSGGVAKFGVGTLRFAASAANTYSGITSVKEGTLELDCLNFASVPADLIIGDDIGGPGADVVRLLMPNQIGDTSTVSIASSGFLDFNNNGDNIGGLSGSGAVALGTANFAVNLVADTNIFSGVISGTGGLIKSGTGKLILSGDNLYTGLTIVSVGTLEVDGFQPASSVQVNSAARLQGVGTVGNLIGSGNSFVFAPGNSPGILTCSNFTGGGTGLLEFELAGTTPGIGYDQINARGTVNLTGQSLSASLNFPSSLSNQFVIISNDGVDAVTGTFSGRPEGSTFTIGSQQFQINYHGGDGNDVVLTQISGVFHPVLLIDHAGANAVRLLWPTNPPGFNLEFNTNLATTNWLPEPTPPSVIGTSNVVTNTAGLSQKFYRLKK